jgi:hypothetical protein
VTLQQLAHIAVDARMQADARALKIQRIGDCRRPA